MPGCRRRVTTIIVAALALTSTPALAEQGWRPWIGPWKECPPWQCYADLVIDAINAVPPLKCSEAKGHATATFSVTIRNVGYLTAKGIPYTPSGSYGPWVRVKTLAWPTQTADVMAKLGALPVGQTKTVQVKFDVVTGAPFTDVGVGAEVDPLKKVTEVSETNNYMERWFKLGACSW